MLNASWLCAGALTAFTLSSPVVWAQTSSAPLGEAIVLYTRHSTYVVPLNPQAEVLNLRGTFVQDSDGSVSGRAFLGKRTGEAYVTQGECANTTTTLASLVGGIGYYAYTQEATCPDTSDHPGFHTVHFAAKPRLPVPKVRFSHLCDPTGADRDKGPLLKSPHDVKQFKDTCIAELSPKLKDKAIAALDQDGLRQLKTELEACSCPGTWANSIIYSGYGRLVALHDDWAPYNHDEPQVTRTVIHGQLDPKSCALSELCGSTLDFRKSTPKANPLLVSSNENYALAWGSGGNIQVWAKGQAEPLRTVRIDGPVVGARWHAYSWPLTHYLDQVKRNTLVADETFGTFPKVSLPWVAFSQALAQLLDTPSNETPQPEPWSVRYQIALDQINARLPANPEDEPSNLAPSTNHEAEPEENSDSE